MSETKNQSCRVNVCHLLEYCTRTSFLALDQGEVTNAEIVRAVRFTTYEATQTETVMPSEVREWLNDKYRDAELTIINRNGIETDLPMECFEPRDARIDNGTAEKWDEALREFFRTNACSPPRQNCHVFVTQKWHRQFVTMASVVGVSFPNKSRWWPRIINGQYVDPRVANTNRAPKTK